MTAISIQRAPGTFLIALLVCSIALLGACTNKMIGDSTIGVRLRNDCSNQVLVAATDERVATFSEIAEPIEVEPGDTISISLVINAAYDNPKAFFLTAATRRDSQSPVIMEFDVETLEDGRPQVVMEADCETISVLSP